MTRTSQINSLVSDGPITMGNQDVFEKVFRTYHKALHYFAQQTIGDSTIAEDIVAEVFLKCWTDCRAFENEQHTRFFLYRAVRNAALNHLKIGARFQKKHKNASAFYDYFEESYQEHYIRSEILRDIYSEIESLPTQERRVLMLTLYEGKKLQEIADELTLSVQTIKNCKSRALRRLRSKLSIEDFLLLYFILHPPFS